MGPFEMQSWVKSNTVNYGTFLGIPNNVITGALLPATVPQDDHPHRHTPNRQAGDMARDFLTALAINYDAVFA